MIKVALLIAVFLPFIALGIIILDDLGIFVLSEAEEMFVLFNSIGISLIISAIIMMIVNSTKKDGEHVATAPYAGAQKGLSKRSALICNGALFCLGLFSIGAAFYAYMNVTN